MSIAILRGDARSLPLSDESVDLIVTSPPYFGLRSYTDDGKHYDGQIGSEATPAEWLAALLACTAEMTRVLKPSGSVFVNLGDKYDSGTSAARVNPGTVKDGQGQGWNQGTPRVSLGQPKSLLGLPWRYAIACMDELGLILRRDIIWHKVNPLPESVTDRAATRHEYLFHFVKQPRYYAAIDEIREPHTGGTHARRADGKMPPKEAATVGSGARNGYFPADLENPLGKLPGSVWEIPSQPLVVPPSLAVDHFAAFPCEIPRRCILGWSPPAICLECGEGRFPVAHTAKIEDRKGRKQRIVDYSLDAVHGHDGRGGERWKRQVAITGYACRCTPHTDHAARAASSNRRDRAPEGTRPQGDYARKQAGEYERVGPWREYHLDGWKPPPSRPTLVVDPFGGTGTTSLVADVLGRNAVTFDLSADYCRLARWRTTDPGERARALGVPKPPPVPDGQDALFDLEAS